MFFAPGDNNMRIMPILVPFNKIVTIRKHQLEVECSFIFSSYFFYLNFSPFSSYATHTSLQFAEEVEQSLVKFFGFFHVAGMASSFQL